MKPFIFRTKKKIFQDCLDKVQLELSRPIDKHSKRLISRNIELLLDYCMRFYERQFVTRSKVNKDVLVKFEELLDLYFQSEQSQTEGLPTVKYFVDKVNLSSNYFGDLVKKETGKTAQEYIQGKIINVAKEKILASEKQSVRLHMNWDSNTHNISHAYLKRMLAVPRQNTG